MKKGIAVVLAVLSALICVALLACLEEATGMLNNDAGTIIAFVNAAIGYFGGRALYKVFLNIKPKSKKEEITVDVADIPRSDNTPKQPQQVEQKKPKYDNSTLGDIIAGCNIPDSLIPRVIDLYKINPELVSALHGNFSAEQLNEIISGLENGQDITFFMNENLTAEQMRAIRENLPSSK